MREALIDLERLREREVRARRETEILLEGLHSLSRAPDSAEMFGNLFALLRRTFEFEDVFVLQPDQGEVELCVANTTDPIYANEIWLPDKLFQRVIDGDVVAVFDVAQITEWQSRSEAIRRRVVSALHAPLHIPGGNGVLIGTQSRRGAFTRDHVETLRRMVLLVEQALLNAEARESLRRESELLVHRDELQSMVDAQTIDLIAAKEEAEAANASKNRFLAGMTHELRTPLHGVISFAELGLRGGEKLSREKIARYFQRIVDSGRTLLHLVDQLLDLAKMEAGKMEFRFVELNLAEVTQMVIREFESMAHEKQVKIAGPSGRFRLVADAERLKQVVRNLVSNALKHSPHGSQIALGIEAREGTLLLNVDDEGPGIPEHEREAVFGNFIQSSQHDGKIGGTGLGLAVCREIVDAHGGRIWVEGNACGGAGFRMLLPTEAGTARRQDVA